jgi:cytochrome c
VIGVRKRPFYASLAAVVITFVVITFGVPGAPPALAQDSNGRRLFEATCTPCHNFDKDSTPDLYGQTLNLYGVIGRKAASVSDFQYSGTMKATNRTWDAQSVESFIAAPREFVPGTRMELPGVPDPEIRRAIIEFLATAK